MATAYERMSLAFRGLSDEEEDDGEGFDIEEGPEEGGEDEDAGEEGL